MYVDTHRSTFYSEGVNVKINMNLPLSLFAVARYFWVYSVLKKVMQFY